ncbi:uro-adherence factor A-like isoform X2 [Heptranchias perlo]|uniref:uro-adherence factor A-like isoform X2 n=1 Tax=Heptranchias perlo TaxID=212740 RepID=UPI003559608E
MSGEAALPRLELPKQPYRSRYYRDQAIGRLTGKPITIISQKNANASTILNNFLAGLDSINNSGSLLDSASHLEVQFSKEKNLVKESTKDLQGKKKSSVARLPLQLPENNQSHQVAELFTDKITENNGYCSSSKHIVAEALSVAVVDDQANVGGGGGDEGDFADEAEEPILIDVEALVPQADMSTVEKFGITYNAETSIVNSTPKPSKLKREAKPKMRLSFNTSVTPIVLKSPLVGIKGKNIASSTSGLEKQKILSNYFGKKPAVSALPPPAQVVPSISAPKCNDFEFELMEEESFSFESRIIIPRKTQVLSQKPDEQENKSVSNITEIKKKEKHQKTARKEVAATYEKQEKLLHEPLSLPKQLEGKKTPKLNKLIKPEEAGKRSAVPLLRNNVEGEQEELQTEPSSSSKLSLTPKQKTKLGYQKQGKSGKKCAIIQSNRDEQEAFQEELPLCDAEKASGTEKFRVSEQGAVNSKNSAESGSSVNLPKAVASNRKRLKIILCTGPETPNKNKVVKGPMSSDHYSFTKCVNPVSMPLTETIADVDENDKLAGSETQQSRTSLFSGKNKEATNVNAGVNSRLPQRIKSKGPSLNASETPAVLNSICVDNKQKGYPTENVVPSTSGFEKQKKEQASLFPKPSFYSFGIRPAVSALPQPKQAIPITSAPNREFEFELEEEESFCFESWITIPKKAIVLNQDPTEQENKSVLDAKEMKKKERIQKTETTRKEVTIQSKKNNDEKQLARNKKNKAKNENQPKESGKRSAVCLLKKNKAVVNIEKEQRQIQNESLFHSKRLLSPKQRKLGKLKRGRPRKKSIVKSDGDEEQEELQERREELHKEPSFRVEEKANRTEKSRLSEQGMITSKKLPESGSSVNMPLSHSKHLLTPKQTKLGNKKQGKPRKKTLGESDRAEEQEEFQEEHSFRVEENENRTEKSEVSEHSEMNYKKFPESGSSVNLPRGLHIDEVKSKLTSFAKPGIQNKKRAKKRQKHKPTVKEKEMSKKGTRLKKPGYSKKCIPSPYELDESLPQGNALDVYTRSRRLTRPPPKWWVVQHDGNHPQKRLKTDYLSALNDSLQDRMVKAKSSRSQMKKKQMVLKRRSSRAQTKPLETDVCSSEEQNFEEDVFENDCSPGSPPHSQSKPPRQRETANQGDNHSGSVSVSRQRKYSSASSLPKKRLFSEAEEEKAKPSDMHSPKKQKSILKLKVHNFDVQDKIELEEEEEYCPLSRPAHVCTTSRQTKDYISLSSKPTSQKPFRESLASFGAAYVDKKTPQKPADRLPAIAKVSAGTPNRVVMSPRKSITKSADRLPANTKVSAGTPNRVVMRPRKSDTMKYQDKIFPSQLCEQTSDESEEDDEPEPSTSVQSKGILKQGLPCSALPVFNKSGPGPCVNYEDASSDAGDSGNFDHHEETMDFGDANEDVRYTKESIIYPKHTPIVGRSKRTKVKPVKYRLGERVIYETEESVSNIVQTDADPGNSGPEDSCNCEKEPSEVDVQESLKPTCVWNVKESREILVDCVRTSEMCNFFYPLKTEYEDNRSIAICKSLNWKTFSCGKLVLGPYKEKGCQMVYKDTMIFHILKGDLGITIYRTTYHLKEGDYFFVPSGNTYNVTNLLDTEAVLLFTQLKGAKMD